MFLLVTKNSFFYFKVKKHANHCYFDIHFILVIVFKNKLHVRIAVTNQYFQQNETNKSCQKKGVFPKNMDRYLITFFVCNKIL